MSALCAGFTKYSTLMVLFCWGHTISDRNVSTKVNIFNMFINALIITFLHSTPTIIHLKIEKKLFNEIDKKH